jgi:hypothetical protein
MGAKDSGLLSNIANSAAAPIPCTGENRLEQGPSGTAGTGCESHQMKALKVLAGSCPAGAEANQARVRICGLSKKRGRTRRNALAGSLGGEGIGALCMRLLLSVRQEAHAASMAKWPYSSGGWMGSQLLRLRQVGVTILPDRVGKVRGERGACPTPLPDSRQASHAIGDCACADTMIAFLPPAPTLIHTAVNLQAVPTAVDDVDQALGIKLDGDGPPQKTLHFTILGRGALLHVVWV